MDDVYAYIAQLPRGVREMVTPCADGYTVYVDAQLDSEARINAYNHALGHIARRDFEKEEVQKIEVIAHDGFIYSE